MDGTEPGSGALGPFFPDPRACGPLLERAAALVAEGHRLEAAQGPLAAVLRPLLCSLNAAAASALDGQALRADEIERVDGADPRQRRARLLARAHVAAEAALSAALPQRSVGLYAPEFVQCIHAELHRAPAAPRAGDPAEAGAGASGVGAADASSADAAPGAWRRAPVGERRGARAEDIPEEMDTWQGVYGRPFAPEQAVVAALCAGHRLFALRPFERGNGRTARLHTHLALTALGLTQGLWSPLRALARDRDTYRRHLRAAIAPAPAHARARVRRERLEAAVAWQLDACLDDARAARERLDGERLEPRLLELLAWLAARPWTIGSEKSVIKPDALEALHYAALRGSVERARFIAMLGLQHRTGRRVLSSLIDCGLLVSESSRAKVRFNLPWPSLRFLFPGLAPELAENEGASENAPWSSSNDQRPAVLDARAVAITTHPPPPEPSAAMEPRGTGLEPRAGAALQPLHE